MTIINLEHTNDFLVHLVSLIQKNETCKGLFEFDSVKSIFDYLNDDFRLVESLVPEVYNFFTKKYYDSYGFTEEFKEFLKTSDFFYCPASVKYHSNHVFGLLYHSLLVFDLSLNKFKDLIENSKYYSFNLLGNELNLTLERELFFSTVFHDLCKAGTYKLFKGKSEVFYNTDNKSLGHGSYSAYLLTKYQRVSELVFSIVNYHMGTWNLANTQDVVESSSYRRVRQLNALVDIVHLSDTEAGVYEFTYTRTK